MSAQKPAPQRVKSAGTASVTGVLQRTHGFFSTLKVIIRYWLLPFWSHTNEKALGYLKVPLEVSGVFFRLECKLPIQHFVLEPPRPW